MDKKYLTSIIGIVVIMLLTLLIIFLLKKPTQVDVVEPELPEYSNEPTSWVDEDSQGIKFVNVEKVTKGYGFFNSIDMQYKKDKIWTVFIYDGLYQGTPFDTEYLDKIRITQDLIPDNGIMEGIIVLEFVDEKPIAYIFLDQDWKNTMGSDTNIVWGASYENMKKFEFNSISEGIYMDQVDDDPKRWINGFSERPLGGIVVGNVVPQQIEQGIIEGITSINLR